jgi:hypothetical protein
MKAWRSVFRVALVSLLALVGGSQSRAQMTNSSLERTNELTGTGSVVSLPGLTIHGGEKKFIEATGRMALTDGILEFIAVASQGRDYESLLALDCKPSELQFALLLIGCETGAVPGHAKAGEKPGSPLMLELEWQDEGQTRSVPVERLLVDRRTKKTPDALLWVFNGSYFAKSPVTNREVFQADEEQAFIALWWEPSVLINLGAEYGDPYRGDNQGFEVKTSAVPPKDTPVKLILRKRG